MAGYLPPAGRASLLNYLATQGAYLGLAQSVGLDATPQLADMAEPTTGGYARVPVVWVNATEANPQLQNLAALQIGPMTADMPPCSYAFLTNSVSGTVLAPPVLTLGAAASGGTFAAGQYYWTVTAVNSKGETVSSNEVSATLTLNQKQTLSWTAPADPPGTAYDVTGYNVYRGTVSGAESVLVGSTSAGTLTLTDTGVAGTPQAPPSYSTAAIGDVFYIWELPEPVSALSGKPVYVPANGLIVE